MAAPLFVLNEATLRKVDEAAGRLFTEDRMTADEMRDMAQSLKSVINECVPVPATPSQLEALTKA